MTDLKCMVTNCTYNKEMLCSKGDIMVGGKKAEDKGETCCESFSPKRAGMDGYTSSIAHPSHTISIDCEASKCVYNQNYKCMAEHVEISGNGACNCKETLCATFREK